MTEKLRDDRDSGYTNGTVGDRTVHSPFRFGTWIRLHALDILTLAAMGAIALGVHYAGPAPRRSFPLYNSNGGVAWEQYAYPHRDEILPLWAVVLISFFAPFLFITLFQMRRRSADDWLTTTLGLLKSLVTAAVIQVLIRWLIGGLRPHFYSVCQPSVGAGTLRGSGFAQTMYDRTICTGDRDAVDEALMSMPSGHATAAWAGLFYLSLYFNAQLKVMSAHNPAYWKMVMFFAPLLGAFLISGSKTIDAHHNWYDLVVGGIIGILCALVAFRQTFAAITDFRFNHILLPRASSLFHRQKFLPIAGRGPYYSYHTQKFQTHDLPFTREGGWSLGGGEQDAGAPGDATVLFGGSHNYGGSTGNGTGAGFGHHDGVGATGATLGHNAPVGTTGATLGHNAPVGTTGGVAGPEPVGSHRIV